MMYASPNQMPDKSHSEAIIDSRQGEASAMQMESDAVRMNSALNRIKDYSTQQQMYGAPSQASKITYSNNKPQPYDNPFKENVSQANTPNFNGGPLYGVSERDNWLLAKDEEVDEVHISKPNKI